MVPLHMRNHDCIALAARITDVVVRPGELKETENCLFFNSFSFEPPLALQWQIQVRFDSERHHSGRAAATVLVKLKCNVLVFSIACTPFRVGRCPVSASGNTRR